MQRRRRYVGPIMMRLRSVVAAVGSRWRSGWTSRRAAVLTVIAAALATVLHAGPAAAAPATISGSFSPPAITVGSTSDLTFTVTNPNGTPLTNVQFGYTAPA